MFECESQQPQNNLWWENRKKERNTREVIQMHLCVFFINGYCLSPFGLLLQNTTTIQLISKRNLCLTVGEAGSPKSHLQQGCVLAETNFLVQSHYLFTASLPVRKGKGLYRVSFLRTLIPFIRVLPSHDLKVPSSKAIIFGVQDINI